MKNFEDKKNSKMIAMPRFFFVCCEKQKKINKICSFVFWENLRCANLLTVKNVTILHVLSLKSFLTFRTPLMVPTVWIRVGTYYKTKKMEIMTLAEVSQVVFVVFDG